VRQERLKRQVELGISPAGTQLAERMWFLPDPVVLAPAASAILGKKMELYAGMVENLDFHVGRLVDHLKAIGEYENTIFIVFGDNGAEGTDLFRDDRGHAGTKNFLFAASKWSQTHRTPGAIRARTSPTAMWAQVSMTPFSQYKGFTAEGGIRNALVVSGPAVKRAKGSVNRGLMHVADVMPTLLEVAGARYPKTLAGRELPPLMGKSWVPVLAGQAESPARIRTSSRGRSSATAPCARGTGSSAGSGSHSQGEWELFDLAADPAERKDLAAERPTS